jgi:short-subunit dehydrogenase
VSLTLICPGYIATNLFAAGTYGGNLSAEQAIERIPFKLLDIPSAVEATLRAVLAKKKIAAFPGYVRAMWLLHRYWPGLLSFFFKLAMADQRKRFAAGTR